jgi:hypothetical protein
MRDKNQIRAERNAAFSRMTEIRNATDDFHNVSRNQSDEFDSAKRELDMLDAELASDGGGTEVNTRGTASVERPDGHTGDERTVGYPG